MGSDERQNPDHGASRSLGPVPSRSSSIVATKRTIGLLAVVCSLVLLAAIILSPREPRPRIAATLVKRVTLWGNPEAGLIFSVSNSTSKPLELGIGLKQQPPDYPRGGNAILPGNGSTNLQVDATRVPKPWTVRIVSLRVPGPLETRARALGARLRLCEFRQKPEVEAELIIKE
jgi:hypothetical protein